MFISGLEFFIGNTAIVDSSPRIFPGMKFHNTLLFKQFKNNEAVQ